MNTIILLLIIIAVVAIVGYFATRKSSLERRAKGNKRKYRLALGVQVSLEDGEPYPNLSMIAGFIADFLREAQDKGYSLDRSNLHIAFLKPDGVSETGVPVFIIKSGKYNDTQYSTNGRMKIGGQFFEPDLIILPTQRNDAEMREVLKHELIHFAHFVDDKVKWERFKIHREGEVFEL